MHEKAVRRDLGTRFHTILRIPSLAKHLENIKRGEKVLVYTHLVEGITKDLLDEIKAKGHAAGLLTGGTDDTDLGEFLKPNGSVDVLIASSRIGTGVDGLQHVCNKLIINVLPWTNAEYEPLGRCACRVEPEIEARYLDFAPFCCPEPSLHCCFDPSHLIAMSRRSTWAPPRGTMGGSVRRRREVDQSEGHRRLVAGRHPAIAIAILGSRSDRDHLIALKTTGVPGHEAWSGDCSTEY